MIASDTDVGAVLNDIAVATGQAQADLLLRHCRLVNVASNETYATDLAIQNGRIVAIRPEFSGGARQIVDCDGLFAVPGLIGMDVIGGAPERSCSLVSCKVSQNQPAAAPRQLWQKIMEEQEASVTAAPCHPIGLCNDFSGLLELLRAGTTPFINLAELQDPEVMFRDIASYPISPARLRFAGIEQVGTEKLQNIIQAGMTAGLTVAQIYRMASFGPALSFALDHMLGCIAPGRRADITLLNDPADLRPVKSFRSGRFRADG